ncbi:hypothetical protein BH10PSE7_BH10PSE7_01120 [soil metagenome]
MLGLLLAAVPLAAQEAGKDQSQLPQTGPAPVLPPAQPQRTPPAEPDGEDLTAPDGAMPGDTDSGENTPDEPSLGEIPDIQVIELTTDITKRALDAFSLVRDKYKDANLEEYENLQDFVDQTEDGKRFEADIKAAGFASVNDWNTAITTVGFAYSAITDDPTADINAQIEDIKKDDTIAKDMKDRMIKSLLAMIPSDNNKKVVQALIDDPAYADKLKLLDEEQE